MTEENNNLSKGRKIAKSIRRHVINYIFIAIAGSICVILASALLKAYIVKRPLDKGPSYLTEKRFDELIHIIETSAQSESLFPALKPRRDCLAIRCYARKGDLGKAMGIADAMATATFPDTSILTFLKGFVPPESANNLVDRFSYFISHMEQPVASLIDGTFRKQNVAMGISRWTGYTDLADELKATSNVEDLSRLLKTAQKYHPEADFTKSLAKYLEEADRLAQHGRKMPHPDEALKDAPFGWGIVTKEETSVYDSKGAFLRKVTAGTVIEVDEIRPSKSGQIVMGSLHLRNGDKPGIVVVATDLTLKRGMIFEVEEATMNLLLRRAEITQQIADAKESAKTRLANSNPHYAGYKKLSEEYKALWVRIDDITAKFKATTGADRETYADELRTLKSKNIVLSNQIKEAKAQNDSWLQANANLVSSEPETANLTQQLRQVEEQLKQIGYL